jgi:hypothetical protein
MKSLIIALAILSGCASSQRTDTLKAALVTVDAARDGFLAYDGPHLLELARSGPDKVTASAAVTAYQLKRAATVDKAFAAAYRSIAIAQTLNDQPSLEGVQSAITQVYAAYEALKETEKP